MSIPRWGTSARFLLPSFSNGADGAVNFNGTATVLGLAPATVGSFKVYSLTRDIYPSTMIVGSSVIIAAINWRVIAKTSITGAGSGVSFIHCNGNDAGLSVAGSSSVHGAALAAGYYQSSPGGGIGSTPNNFNGLPNPFCFSTGTAAAGTAGTNTSTAGGTATTPMKGGGGGGAGAASGGVAGNQGGTHALVGAPSGYDYLEQMMGHTSAVTTKFQFGSGGGGGGTTASGSGGVTASCGGGGGGAAGCLFITAQTISGISTTANGGKGADGIFGSLGTISVAGGGGGGGGGIVIMHYNSRSDVICTSSGGGAGLGSSRGGGSASSGGAGTAGWTFEYNLSGDGT